MINDQTNRFQKDDPTLWINRPKEGFINVRSDLCITASRKQESAPCGTGYVTEVRLGLTLLLCRHIRQGEAELAIPVERTEAAGWNVPASALINGAIENTSSVFPAQVRDLLRDETYVIGRNKDGTYSFDSSYEEAQAAEIETEYEGGTYSKLRFIINAAPATGEALIFYPGLLSGIGRKLRRDPLVLSAAPGKLYIFDSDKNRNNLTEYLNRYMERFKTVSFDPHIYKYYRENKIVYDLNPDSTYEKKLLQKAHIPQGSVISAWGDVGCRSRLLEPDRIDLT
ncbi:MAG: hypothetical protein K5871_10675 [Lachnospiraceae bacterium]|nr:hypothetical protein [Lachnospiraceae bacterium]